MDQYEAAPSHTATAPHNNANIVRIGHSKVVQTEDDWSMDAKYQSIKRTNTLPDIFLVLKLAPYGMRCNKLVAVSRSLNKTCLSATDHQESNKLEQGGC